ncbi:MAG TPA: preprotein translocase subunit SecG [Xanthobacteraceae bacterium]|nr:preprotein translocase subunit SecG [Xanthobacteraceae bacterium]
MLSVVIAIHLMLVLAMIGVVLLQKSEGGGFVSSTSGFMTGRGTANVLTRTTALLAAGFFITSLTLSLLAAHSREPVSLIPGGTPTQQAPAPNAPPPVAPLNSGNNGLLGQLGGGGKAPSANAPSSAPAAPAPAPAAPAPAPSGPQVPESH